MSESDKKSSKFPKRLSYSDFKVGNVGPHMSVRDFVLSELDCNVTTFFGGELYKLLIRSEGECFICYGNEKHCFIFPLEKGFSAFYHGSHAGFDENGFLVTHQGNGIIEIGSRTFIVNHPQEIPPRIVGSYVRTWGSHEKEKKDVDVLATNLRPYWARIEELGIQVKDFFLRDPEQEESTKDIKSIHLIPDDFDPWSLCFDNGFYVGTKRGVIYYGRELKHMKCLGAELGVKPRVPIRQIVATKDACFYQTKKYLWMADLEKNEKYMLLRQNDILRWTASDTDLFIVPQTGLERDPQMKRSVCRVPISNIRDFIVLQRKRDEQCDVIQSNSIPMSSQ